MKFLITGHNGFVGKHLCADLVQRGEDFTVFSFRDLLSDKSRSTIPSADVCIHLAAISQSGPNPTLEETEHIEQVNVGGTLALARAAHATGFKRFIFLSSVKSMGESSPSGLPLTARSTPQPEDAYGRSKLAAENALVQLGNELGLEIVIIRAPMVYGPGVKGNFRLLDKLSCLRVPLPFGLIHNRRSLISVFNLVDFILHTARHREAPRQIWLISDGYDLSTPELMRKMASARGGRAYCLPVPVSMLNTLGRLFGKAPMIRRLCDDLQIDISDTCHYLDWKPPFTIEQTLAEMAPKHRTT